MSLAALSPAGAQVGVDLRHCGGDGVVDEVSSLELLRSISRIRAAELLHFLAKLRLGPPFRDPRFGLGSSGSLQLQLHLF